MTWIYLQSRNYLRLFKPVARAVTNYYLQSRNYLRLFKHNYYIIIG
ncbi:group II intron reverse transcriptase/maturase [Lachnospira eligens]